MVQPLPGMWFCRMGPDFTIESQGKIGNQTGIELYLVSLIKKGGPGSPSIHVFRLAEMVATPGSELDQGAWVFFESEDDLAAWVALLTPPDEK